MAYDLTQDKELRNRYESAFGTLRVGRLLEDMDALAGSVAYLHVDDGDPDTAPPILVTASMERLEVRDDTLALDEDYNLVGSLVWAGRSSLEIVAELRHKQDDAVALSAVFTFVARKRDGSGGHMVPPLSPETPREQQLFDAAAAIQAQRKAQRQAAKDPSKKAESAAARDAQIEALLKPGRIARIFRARPTRVRFMHETLEECYNYSASVTEHAGQASSAAPDALRTRISVRDGVRLLRVPARASFRETVRVDGRHRCARRGPSRKSASCARTWGLSWPSSRTSSTSATRAASASTTAAVWTGPPREHADEQLLVRARRVWNAGVTRRSDVSRTMSTGAMRARRRGR